jgi:hypothetical protein
MLLLPIPAPRREHDMPNTSKNQSGGHSHPQKDDANNSDQKQSRDARNSWDGKALPSGEKVKSHEGPKEDFGSKGTRDNH